ncbi:MAG: PqiC family protein [Desulfobulbus sp.]|nr:PqiC family protein [Desulfobulbus sp.]
MNEPCPLPRLVLVSLLAVLLTACAAPTPPVVYHSLLGPETAAPATTRAHGPAVVVGPVRLPDILYNTRLATGSDGRYQLAENHRWAGAVDREIERALAERLAADLATERVALFPQQPAAETVWRVQAEVLALDGEPGHTAHLDVRWTLLNPAGQAPLTRRSEYREPLSKPDLTAWVAGQRTNLARLGAEIGAAIRKGTTD